MYACSRGFARGKATLARKAEARVVELEHQELTLEARFLAGSMVTLH